MGIHPFSNIIYGWEVEQYDIIERFIKGEITTEFDLERYLRKDKYIPVSTLEELEEYLKSDECDIPSDFGELIFEFDTIWDIDFAMGGEYNYDYMVIGKRIHVSSDPEQFKRAIDSAVYQLETMYFPFTEEFMEELGEPKVIEVLGIG